MSKLHHSIKALDFMQNYSQKRSKRERSSWEDFLEEESLKDPSLVETAGLPCRTPVGENREAVLKHGEGPS